MVFFTHIIFFFCWIIVKKEVRFGIISLIDCKAGAEAGACQTDDLSWNEVSLGSRDRLICNGHGVCVSSPYNSADNTIQITYHHLDENGQKFYLDDSLSHPGFHIIKNDNGKCLSVQGNTNQTGAEIWSNDCNSSEMGQHWKWRNHYFFSYY